MIAILKSVIFYKYKFYMIKNLETKCKIKFIIIKYKLKLLVKLIYIIKIKLI